MEEQPEAVVWVVLGLAMLGLVLLATLRWVPAGHLLIATRRGVVARVAGPGLFVRLPVLDRVQVVPAGPEEVALAAHGTTRDGTEVRVLATATVRRTAPTPAQPYVDPIPSVAGAVEEVLAAVVAEADLGGVTEALADHWQEVVARADERSRSHGAEVLDIDLDALDAVLTARPASDGPDSVAAS